MTRILTSILISLSMFLFSSCEKTEQGAPNIEALESDLIESISEGDWERFLQLTTEPDKLGEKHKLLIQAVEGGSVEKSSYLEPLAAFKKHPDLVSKPGLDSTIESVLVLEWSVDTQFGKGEAIQCFGVTKIDGKYFVSTGAP